MMAVMRSADRGSVTAVKRCGDATLMTETRTRVSSAYRRAGAIKAANVMNHQTCYFQITLCVNTENSQHCRWWRNDGGGPSFSRSGEELHL